MTGQTGDRGADGYRRTPGAGPAVRSDIVEVYVFRVIAGAALERSGRGIDSHGRDARATGNIDSHGRDARATGDFDSHGRDACATGDVIEVLQLRRSKAPMLGDWHPIIGHIDGAEAAVDCARRELAEEVGLHAGDPAWSGFWQLEQVHPYFMAEIDAIVLSPRFAAEVSTGWTPILNHEHDDARWVAFESVGEMFVWPGQKAACCEIINEIARGGSLARDRLRLATGGAG